MKLTEIAIRKEIDQLCFFHNIPLAHAIDMIDETDVYECQKLIHDIIADNKGRVENHLMEISVPAAFRQKMRERIRIYQKAQAQALHGKSWIEHVDSVTVLHESGWRPDEEHLVGTLQEYRKSADCNEEDYATGLKFLSELCG